MRIALLIGNSILAIQGTWGTVWGLNSGLFGENVKGESSK
jgi:ABC-type dipeptide/oligopeptide/nickel transport system permease subunit